MNNLLKKKFYVFSTNLSIDRDIVMYLRINLYYVQLNFHKGLILYNGDIIRIS